MDVDPERERLVLYIPGVGSKSRSIASLLVQIYGVSIGRSTILACLFVRFARKLKITSSQDGYSSICLHIEHLPMRRLYMVIQ